MEMNNKRRFYLDTFLAICRGEIQVRNEDTEPVYKILEILHERGLNVEKADEYFRSTSYVSISDIMVPDLSYGHTQQRREYDEQLEIGNIRVIGTKVSDVDKKEFGRLYDTSAGYILPEVPSIQGVAEFLWLLDKADHEVRLSNADQAEPDLAPIVVNTQDNEIFKIISDAVGLTKEDYKKYNITAISARDKDKRGVIKDVCREIEKLVEERGTGLKTNDELSFAINEDANFLLATTKDKKLLEQEIFFERYGINCSMLSKVLGNHNDPDELHGNIVSNAVGVNNRDNTGKMYNIADFIKEKYTKEELVQELQSRGINPYNTFIVADDRGSTIPADIAKQFILRTHENMPTEIKHLIFGDNEITPQFLDAYLEKKIFPGSEIKHAIAAAGGIEGFWKTIDEICNEHGFDRSFYNNCSVVVMPILDVYEKQPRKFVTTAQKKYHVSESRHPDYDTVVESEQYLIPKDLKNKSKERTLGDYFEENRFGIYFKHSDIGKCCTAVVNNFGLRRQKERDKKHYHNYTVGIVDGNYRSGFIDNSGNKSADFDNPVKAEKFLKENDAYVFDASKVTKENSAEFIHALHSAIVAKQTDPRDMGKLLVVYRPSDEARKVLDQYGVLYNNNFIGEYRARMLVVADNDEELGKALDSHSRKYGRVKGEYPNTEEVKVFEKAADKNKGKGVFIQCSATEETPVSIGQAFETAFYIALSGRDIVYGGGDKKMMGAIMHGYKAAEKYAGENGEKFKSQLYAVSTQNLLAKETLKGRFSKSVKPSNTWVAPTIHHRKASLKQSSVEAITLLGGAGTMEEFGKCAADPNYKVTVFNQKGLFNPLKEICGDMLNVKFHDKLHDLLKNEFGCEITDQKDAYIKAAIKRIPETKIESVSPTAVRKRQV